ncbi:MAG TPA: NAD(P)-dependent glycerol-3-phosphate dehydrogenase [Devosia sp.]|nr:NAD(P)-dependent glycerol-3-phosphate dehydrogenase [Devosia sp.]
MGRVGIIGAGAWGTALAQVVARHGHTALLLARSESVIASIRHSRIHPSLGADIELSDRVVAGSGPVALKDADLLVLAVPAQASRSVLMSLDAMAGRRVPVVVTAKGFERDSQALQSDIVGQVWPNAVPVVLSGPSFARDVALGLPTAVTLAATDAEILERVAAFFAGPAFRPYLGDDPVGVQLCGGLKNVYALGSGAIEGAGLGLSARAAFISRAAAEMGRMVDAFGGRPASVAFLAGMGDLVLSCSSSQSRNFRFGLELGRGGKTADIQNRLGFLAEGVASTPVARAMAAGKGVDAPLIRAVAQLLSGRTSIQTIVKDLMGRPIRREG